MHAEKHVPKRKCVVGRHLVPRDALLRIVRTPDSELKIDLTGGRIDGRGAYISPTVSAIELARKKRLLDRALKMNLPSNFYDLLLEHARVDSEEAKDDH